MRRRLSQVAAAVVAAAGIVAAGPVGQAVADPPAEGQFTVIPAPQADGLPRPYFMLSVAPGRSATDIVLFGNNGGTAQQLRVGVTNGVTATNSGSAYSVLARHCAGVACWVTGLPASLTLAPHTEDWVRFQVAVPAHARPGQYLAGITAAPGMRGRLGQARAGSNGATQVIIIPRIVIGVAVTVGPLATLKTRSEISGLTAGWVDGIVRLTVLVQNTGQRFAKGTGTVTCSQAGTTRSFGFTMDTVLPGQGAGLPVNATGLYPGAWQCTARMSGSHGGITGWNGTMSVPGRAPAATRPIGGNDYVVPQPGVLTVKRVALLGFGGGAVSLGLWALWLRRRRYSRWRW